MPPASGRSATTPWCWSSRILPVHQRRRWQARWWMYRIGFWRLALGGATRAAMAPRRTTPRCTGSTRPGCAGRSARFWGSLDPLAAEYPERLDAVFPGDLLAFIAGARAVTDRDLVGTDAPA